ncbi:MAG: recombinase zinc beta ribbon domain-containing protein [Oscillospiraceae bacterium]|nr:recombinase zinc beta ribbon domain-containing protein [Oscillospiraceae bacterium]
MCYKTAYLRILFNVYALLQKTFCTDFLTKKKKINEGEIPQYYVKNSHEAIIEPEIFEAVQNEIKARDNLGRSTIHIFSSKLVCDDCGSYFGSKLWHSTDKYRCRIWRCNNKFKNKIKCRTPHLKEGQIKNIFVMAFNKLMSDKSGVIADCRAVLEKFCDTSEFNDKIEKLINEKDEIEKCAKELVLKNAKTPLDQDVYNEEYNKFLAKFENIKQKILDLEKQKAGQILKKCQAEAFLKKISKTENFLKEFNEELWFTLVKNITVKSNGASTVVFKNGKEVEVEI